MAGQMDVRTVLQAAYDAGFRGDDLITAAGIAYVESGYKPAAHNGNTNTGDNSWGLWQINVLGGMRSRLDRLGLSDPSELADPATNARAAFMLYQGRGGNFGDWIGYRTAGPRATYLSHLKAANLPGIASVAQSMGLFQPRGVQGGGFTMSINTGAGVETISAPSLPDPATVQIGRGDYTGSTGASLPSGASVAPQVDPTRMPGGGQVWQVGGRSYMVYDFYNLAQGAPRIVFDLQGQVPSGFPVSVLSDAEFQSYNVVDGGSASELTSIADQYPGPTGFQDAFRNVLDLTFGENPARSDPEVLRVMMEFFGRPDMTDQELDSLLGRTEWFKQRTEKQLAWNDLSPAEQSARVDEQASRLAQMWFTYVGETASVNDMAVWAQKIASGAMGEGEWTEVVAKQQALSNPESPWSRRLRDERQAQNQFGVNVDTQAGQVRELAKRWGVQLPERGLQLYGEQLVNGDLTMEEVRSRLRDHAQILFPWKDPEMETELAAQPWLSAYERVMEREVDIFNPSIQRALAAQKSLPDFERDLKLSDEWLSTSNARDSIMDQVSNLGRRMGFV